MRRKRRHFHRFPFDLHDEEMILFSPGTNVRAFHPWFDVSGAKLATCATYDVRDAGSLFVRFADLEIVLVSVKNHFYAGRGEQAHPMLQLLVARCVQRTCREQGVMKVWNHP